MTFGALPSEFCEYAASRAVVLPLSYEATTTYLRGTRLGPTAILEASPALEFYDEELDSEPFRVGIHTGEDLPLTETPGEEAVYYLRLTDVWPAVPDGVQEIMESISPLGVTVNLIPYVVE